MSSEDDPTEQNQGGRSGQGGQTGGQPGQAGGQTGGQPGQAGGQTGGQPGQAQPGRGRPQQVQTGPSATDVLSRPDGQSVIKYVVGIFAVVGVGIGLTGVLADSLLGGGGTGAASFISFGITLMAFGVAIFGGSILAAVIGLQDFLQIGEVDNQTYVLAFASNAAGFIVMGIIVALFISILGGSGGGAGGGGGLGDYIVGSIVMAIPAGLVGAGVTWLRDWQPGIAKN
ncbi:hypothetical protein [Halorientalis pallida]|uniref:Uncharacterized protein n=1 Tax=Halorientalis pallida TaxID=2479928 RepID=A0A498KVL4_9EURY|nr:hypothetical protein [Halorientalis pallida]RXK48629.1 hypothetical protein EAF64_13225 [Halorientalis pallida]